MEVAASAIAIITLVGNVSTICLRLYGSLGAREELNQIIKEVEGFRQILTVVAQLTSSGTGYAQICSESQLGNVLTDCEAEIKRFEVELKKIEGSRLPGLSLPWLLKEKALAQRLETLSRLKQNLQISMQADQTFDHPSLSANTLLTHRSDPCNYMRRKQTRLSESLSHNWSLVRIVHAVCHRANVSQGTSDARSLTGLTQHPSPPSVTTPRKQEAQTRSPGF